MKRVQLRAARERRRWSLERAAEQIGVSKNTVWRWEMGEAEPYAFNLSQMCRVYGMTAAELGLEDGQPPEDSHLEEVSAASPPVESIEGLTESMQHDVELRLQCLIYDWLHRKQSTWTRAMLQQRLDHEIESYNHMNNQDYLNHTGVDLGRRDALRRLVLVPIQVMGLGVLGALGTTLTWAPEDILTHCAVGITACAHLAKGLHQDMTLASWALSAYLPVLKAIAKQSSLHRKEATRLAGQAFLWKTILGVHREGPKQAASYAEQGLIYSKESGDLPLQLAFLKHSAWVYACDRQNEKAAERALEGQYLLEHASASLPALVRSNVYIGVAKNQALNGRKDEALLALSQAHDTFAVASGEDMMISSLMDYDLAHHLLSDGLTHYRLRQYDEALDSFAKIIDPETLALKIPVLAERTRIEIINNQALASLKRANKDMELSIKLWIAGMQGAMALRSEQRFGEALSAYDMMEALWSGEKRIMELRDFTRHW
jgi:transcriptional regulator with XRE-family HTH domain/tetratricopeptide (TPR) repeat protein